MKIEFLLPFMVCGVGFFLLRKLKFFFILHPIRTASRLLEQIKDRDSRRAFFLALAGTLGVGNIFGVAAGIMIGGAGSVFWLLFSSLFAMIIKYAEVALVFDMPERSRGMSGALSSVFGKGGRCISALYATFTVLLALFMGSAIQTKALTDVALVSFSLNPYICGFILMIFFLPCLFGGVKKIESVTEILIPVTTIIYILMCFAVILSNADRIIEIIKIVIKSAFSPSAAAGGGIAIAIKEGFARCILSNEAGAGTSALAHSRSEGKSPHIAGLFGMAEVFFDTNVLCTLTGMTILLSINDISAFSTPMSLVCAAFSGTFGALGGYVLTVLIACFAYSTVICWYFYGHRCTEVYLGKFKILYALLFVGFFFLSTCLSSKFLLYLTDVILLLMSLMTLSAIIKMSDRIIKKGNGA